MPVNCSKLKKLYEQAPGTYRATLREMFGISEQDDGTNKLDRSNRVVEPKHISFDEIAHTFLGRHCGGSDVRRAFGIAEQYGAFREAEGAVVLPSHFANISGFTDTVAGLIDAMTMEGYQSPEFIGDQLTTVEPTKMNGGKKIGLLNDGGVSSDLLPGQMYPTVGLKPTYIELPDNQRFGNAIQINEQVFLYDRTGAVETACTNAGKAVARAKELRQADCVLGITNTYSRDGKTANTYLDTAGDLPVNYVNSSLNELTNYASIDAGIQVLEGNTDPGTGFEITVPAPQLLVMPQSEMNMVSILYPEFIRRSSDSGLTLTQTPKSLVRNVTPVVLTRIWYNRLIAASVSAANAKARWYLGDFKKAFGYRQLVPFQVNSAPLSSDDVRQDIVGVWVAREMGVPYTNEPRYVYMGTKEDITP